MRTLTAAQTNILELNDRSHHVKVSVDRGSGWESFNNLEGYDWVKKWTRTQSVDNNIVSASVEFYKKIYDLNLSILMDGSKLNADGVLLDIGNPIKIETATTPQGETPSSSDYVEVFRGEIEKPSWAGENITVSCLDNMERLNSTFIETQKVYGEAAGEDVEFAMQDIMDDNNPDKSALSGGTIDWQGATTVLMSDTSNVTVGDYIAYDAAPFFKISVITPNTSVTITNPDSRTIPNEAAGTTGSLFIDEDDRWILYTPNGTAANPLNSADLADWAVKQWKQSKESILSAITNLVQQIGYDVRYTYHDNTSAFQYIIDRPPRGLTARGTLTFTDQPVAAELFNINGTNHTVIAAGGTPGGNDVSLGLNLAKTCAYFARDFNLYSAQKDNVYCFKISDTEVGFEWKAPGTAGNVIVFTEALSNCSADGGGTLGATRAGVQATTTSNWTFDNTNYEKFSKISLDRSNIRNVVRLTFTNVDDDARETNLTKKDAASITKYGRRYMEMTEASSSQIDSGKEAADFCTAALEDLKEPEADLGAPVPYFWPVQLWDNITFSADDDHFDTDQTLSVIALKDSFADKKNTTSLALRGKPSGGVKRWLRLEGRPGVAPGLDIYTDDNAQNATITPGLGTIILEYDDPRTYDPPIVDWATSRVYLSTTTGLTKDTGTLVAVGKQTRFEINGLTPGTTYYAVIYIVDNQGNETLASTELTTATYQNSPYFENPDREHGVLLPNQDFGTSTLGNSVPPDFWAMETGTWGSSSDVYINTTFIRSTGQSLQFRNTATTPVEVESNYFPVSEDYFYRFGAWYYIDTYHAGASGINAGIIYMRFYDKDKSYISQHTVSLPVNTTTRTAASWWFDSNSQEGLIDNKGSLPPANARFAKIRLWKRTNSGAETFNMYIDTVVVSKHFASFRASRDQTVSGSQSIAAGSWTTAQLDDEIFDTPDSQYNTGTYTYTVPVSGYYNIMWRPGIQLSSISASEIITARIVGSTETFTGAPVTYANNGETNLYAHAQTGVQYFEAGTTFYPQVKFSGAGTVNLIGRVVGNDPISLFAGAQISIQ